MGSQSRREYNHRVIEHIVPLGADMADLGKAWIAAAREYWSEVQDVNLGDGQNPEHGLPDDWAHVYADDEFVIIRIEVRDGR